ncbi:pyridoxamine 5'-phosphate oxidase family protein [Candidatus Saccharibacteria bacterium TM7i]|nr:pyridoxamine 5'-phosphate oxidase family protein [Candidatus Saccharibacteria bacterium TM7i]
MENIQAILSNNRVGTLATLNVDGSPWATPVHILADNEAVYWFSKDTHQHSLNVENDPRVSIALWSTENGQNGAYISGLAQKLAGEEAEKAFDIVVATFGSIPPVFDGVSAYRVPLGQPNTEKSSEKRWYFYTKNV